MPHASSRHNACDIALLVDEEVGERKSDGRFTIERGTTEAYVLQALEARHGNVRAVPFDPAITPTIEELRALSPRLVFNMTEWLNGNRRMDAAIAGLLEMLELAYTGAAPAGMQLARDKALAKRIVAGLGIRVAPHSIVNGHRRVLPPPEFPLIVKPQFGDGSDGIGNASLVTSERELERRVETLKRRSDEPLMCEAYVPGRDLFVGLVGNEPRVMPPLELVIGRRGARAPRFATSRVKTDAGYRRRWRIRYREPQLASDVTQRLVEASRRIFRALRLRDYARIDYRLTPENQLYFLEANPNPDLTRHTFGRNRCFPGLEYPELIASIVDAALARTS